MSRKVFMVLFLLVVVVVAMACNPKQVTQTPEANMPNPASVYCEQQGNKLEIRTAADGSQSGVCIFPDGSECDEWAYYRGECSPAEPTPTQAPVSKPAEFPTPLPIDPADYQGWWTYRDSSYGFSIQLPADWDVEEVTTADPLMNGHMLTLLPKYTSGKENIRMTFRRVGEDSLLWPTGVGAGDFVPQGTLDVAGQPVQRSLLVCPNGQVTSIWYQGETSPNIQRGDMEFGFIFSASEGHCDEGISLDGKTQRVGEMIISSLTMP
jgi:putative hemolysin